VHFSLKIWHLVATILIIFLRINWPNLVHLLILGCTCTRCTPPAYATGCIRLYLDSKTVSIVATSIVHSKREYCNSLYYNLLKSQMSRLQNSLARAVVKAPEFTQTNVILKCIHWLKISERLNTKFSLSPSNFSIPRNLSTCMTWSLSKLHVILDP